MSEQPFIITAPGAYEGISNEDYHRNPRLLPGPSMSPERRARHRNIICNQKGLAK